MYSRPTRSLLPRPSQWSPPKRPPAYSRLPAASLVTLQRSTAHRPYRPARLQYCRPCPAERRQSRVWPQTHWPSSRPVPHRGECRSTRPIRSRRTGATVPHLVRNRSKGHLLACIHSLPSAKQPAVKHHRPQHPAFAIDQVPKGGDRRPSHR